MRGQIGVEHLVILGVVLIILIPGIYIFYNSTIQASEELDMALLHAAGNKILDTSHTLNALGSLNKKTLSLNLPESFINMTIVGNNTLVMTYEDSKGKSELVFISKKVLMKPTQGKALEEIQPGNIKLSVENLGDAICLSTENGGCGGSCGNGIIEPSLGEVCDGSNLNGFDCSSYGFTAGTLLCSSDCDNFLTDLCINCEYIGPLCLDNNFDSATFASDYVVPLGDTSNPFAPQIGHNNPSFFDNICGESGSYIMHEGGGLLVNFPNVTKTGKYILYSTSLHGDPHYPLNEDISIQCEGEVSDFQDNGEQEQEIIAECYINTTSPDIRLVSYNSIDIDHLRARLQRFEQTWLLYNCGSRCHDVWDSGFVCLAEGVGSNPPQICSDYLCVPMGEGNGGDDDFWSGRSDIPLAYEDACTNTFYFDDRHAIIDWNITGSDFDSLLDPSEPAGTYEVFFNIIWDNSSNLASFDLNCGSHTYTVSKPAHIMGDAKKLITHKGLFCDFNGDGSDRMVINNPQGNERVEFERFKLRKACD